MNMLLLHSPTYCFTSSAQGTLPSTKSYKALHTKASTDSRFQTAPAENPDFKSSEYFRKQGKHKLEPRKLRKITQGYKPTPVPAGLQQIRCLPAWFQGLQVPNSSICERKGCSPFSGMSAEEEEHPFPNTEHMPLRNPRNSYHRCHIWSLCGDVGPSPGAKEPEPTQLHYPAT